MKIEAVYSFANQSNRDDCLGIPQVNTLCKIESCDWWEYYDTKKGYWSEGELEDILKYLLNEK